MRTVVYVFVLCIVLGMIVGCGSSEPKADKIKVPEKSSSQVTGAKGEPEWVARSGGVYEGEHGKAIYAVGSARKAPSYHIMLSQARTRARSELSKILTLQVQTMTKDFTETAGDLYDSETQSAVEYFQDVTRQISNNVLVGSEQADLWKNPEDGTVFILMKISLDVTCCITVSNICCALCTSMRSTREGVSSAVGPLTKMTFAPASAAAWAMA